MSKGLVAEIVMALAWVMFPMIPVILEEFYYQVVVNLLGQDRSGPDPVDWEWGTWLVMLGPLLGYGFLAGSTAGAPDDLAGPHRRLRRVVGRRAVWVAMAPWGGFLFWVAAYLGLQVIAPWLPASGGDPLGSWRDGWTAAILGWLWTVLFFGIFAYGWLWAARLALRRAARIGLGRHALDRGVVTAMAFVGSLFGSFWAIISAWRNFFFDPRVMPMIALAMAAAMLSGCSSTITYGEMRRRELFHAMLLAWVFGLATFWWWSSRRRPRGPGQGPSNPESPRSS